MLPYGNEKPMQQFLSLFAVLYPIFTLKKLPLNLICDKIEVIVRGVELLSTYL